MSALTGAKPFRLSPGMKYFLISVPFIVFTFMFAYVPLFGWIIAFSNYRIGMRITDIEFVGLFHFEKFIAQRNEIIRVLRNTLAMSGLNILFSPLAVVLAIMLNEVRNTKFKKFVQSTTILPHFISWIVVFGIAFSFFSMNGLINTLFGELGLTRSQAGLLGDRDNVWFFQLGLNTWKNIGFASIIYLAAIAGIDSQLYEAAKIDGANKLQCIRHVTVPGVIPTFFVLLILAISNILNTGFDQYFVFFNPLVAYRIEVLDYFVYKIAILVGDMPFSIAVGMSRSIISIVLLFGANYLSKFVRGESIF